jgi:hypothetical protein
MKVRSVSSVALCLALLCGVCLAVAHQYQAGKIVKVEKQESRSSSTGGTDAPLKGAVATYRISIQLGEQVYICRYQADPELDLSWVEGKEVQARVGGKAMYVKRANGKEARGSIVSTEPTAKE